MIEQGEITAGQARPLIGMPNASSIAEEIVAKKLSATTVIIIIIIKNNVYRSPMYFLMVKEI